MPHVTGEERNQFIMISHESTISRDSFVRAIDAFVDAIDMKSFGFSHVQCKEEGRQAFHPSVLMKLYLYGYHYGIRTSRKLEREASLNLEAMWLTSCQNPKYKTISDFRKCHAKAFRSVFRSFVGLLKKCERVCFLTIFDTLSEPFFNLYELLFPEERTIQKSRNHKLSPVQCAVNENRKVYLSKEIFEMSFCTDSR